MVAQELYKRLVVESPASQAGGIIVLDCGHFDSVLGVDEFSTNTADLAIEIFNLAEKERRKGTKFLFTVLIDDVGVVCNEDAMVCVTKETKATPKNQQITEIPSALMERLSTTIGFRANKAKLFSEKTARNRGIQFFRQKVKQSSLDPEAFELTAPAADEPEAQQLFCVLDDGTRVLMADMHSDAVWSGHCPLLMGMHYRDVAAWASKMFTGEETINIIDFSLNNDRGKVNAGAHVALGAADDQPYLTQIANVCFADEDADLYTVDAHERRPAHALPR